MKRTMLFLLGLLAVVAMVAMPAVTHAAPLGALCDVDPDTGPIGTVFHVECFGYLPNGMVNAYYVEPDGAAVTWFNAKADEMGAIRASFYTRFGAEATTAYGLYNVVLDQTGLAKTITRHGEISFRVTGGTEGVSGANLAIDHAKVTRDEPFTVHGSGFDPFEKVSVWYEFPNGDCSTFTFHAGDVNYPLYLGLSTTFLNNFKTDAAGSFTYVDHFFQSDCEGNWHIVARGNTSHRGSDVWIQVGGNEIKTSAWLTPSASKVAALFGTIGFTGGGFAADEPVSCWVTTPEGQATPVFPTVKADRSGGVSFSIFTGSYIPSFIAASEGALGEYGMSCRGDSSKRDAIAHFQVTGGTLDP